MSTGPFPGVKKQSGSEADPSPPSSAAGHERVELYLYSPYGPYGLYRASVPVQGCTLPFTHYYIIFTETFLLRQTCSVILIIFKMLNKARSWNQLICYTSKHEGDNALLFSFCHFIRCVINLGSSSLILSLLMSYIYMDHLFLMFLDHTQRRTTVGRTPLDEWSARRWDLYLTTHDTHNRQISMPPVGFEPKISAGERPYTFIPCFFKNL